MAEKEYIERGLSIQAVVDTPCKMAIDKGKVIRAIEGVPLADVVELRHGHWIESDNLESFNTRGWKRYKKVICSHCKKSNYNNHSNYCPSCGAKMDGKDGADNEK